jgi:acyl-coenzyme A thioesterase PaaI-like protein
MTQQDVPPIAGVVRPPRHHDECFGCGPLSPHGLRLNLRALDRDRAVGRFFLRPDLQGPPSIGHGGVLAMALDEAMSLLVHIRGITARTVSLSVDYLAAAPVGSELEIRATLIQQDGRRLFVEAAVYIDGQDSPLSRGAATFVATGGDAP